MKRTFQAAAQQLKPSGDLPYVVRHHLFTTINIVFILTAKRALNTVIVALWFVEVSCRKKTVSPMRSAVNGLWFCCGIILGLFLARAGQHLLFIPSEKCSRTLTLFSCTVQSAERYSKHTHTVQEHSHTSTPVFFVVFLAAPSDLFLLEREAISCDLSPPA